MYRLRLLWTYVLVIYRRLWYLPLLQTQLELGSRRITSFCPPFYTFKLWNNCKHTINKMRKLIVYFLTFCVLTLLIFLHANTSFISYNESKSIKSTRAKKIFIWTLNIYPKRLNLYLTIYIRCLTGAVLRINKPNTKILLVYVVFDVPSLRESNWRTWLRRRNRSQTQSEGIYMFPLKYHLNPIIPNSDP